MSVIMSETSTSYRADDTQLMLVDSVTNAFIFKHSSLAFVGNVGFSLGYIIAVLLLVAYYRLQQVNFVLFIYQVSQIALLPFANSFAKMNFQQIYIFLDLNQPVAACAYFSYFTLFKIAFYVAVCVVLALCRGKLNYFLTLVCPDDGTFDSSMLVIILTGLLTHSASREVEMLYQVQGKEMLLLVLKVCKILIFLVILSITQMLHRASNSLAKTDVPIKIFSSCSVILNCLALAGTSRPLKFLNFANNKIYFSLKYVFPFRIKVLGIALLRMITNFIDSSDYYLLFLSILILQQRHFMMGEADYLFHFLAVAEIFLFHATLAPTKSYCHFLYQFIGLNGNLGLTHRIKRLVFDKYYVYLAVNIAFCVLLWLISGQVIKWFGLAIVRTSGFQSINAADAESLLRPLGNVALMGILVFPWAVSMCFNYSFNTFGGKVYLLQQVVGFAIEFGLVLLSIFVRNKNPLDCILAASVGKGISSVVFTHLGYRALIYAKLVDFYEAEDRNSQPSSHYKESFAVSKVHVRADSHASGAAQPFSKQLPSGHSGQTGYRDNASRSGGKASGVEQREAESLEAVPPKTGLSRSNTHPEQIKAGEAAQEAVSQMTSELSKINSSCDFNKGPERTGRALDE